MRANNQQGFTLIEVLIALFIFAIVSSIMVNGLRTILSSQLNTEKNAARFAELETTLLFLSRDIEQAINRPIINRNGTVEDAFTGNSESMSLSHGGVANPAGQLLRSTIQRTDYKLQKNTLSRTTWAALDRTSKTDSYHRLLCSGIIKLQFEYLNKTGQFQHYWPSRDDQAQEKELPKAVRIHITFRDLGKISQTYLLPGPKFDKPN